MSTEEGDEPIEGRCAEPGTGRISEGTTPISHTHTHRERQVLKTHGRGRRKRH